MKKLPKTLWAVRLHQDSPSEFISVDQNTSLIEDGEIVGEYTLKATYKKRVLHQLDAQMEEK